MKRITYSMEPPARPAGHNEPVYCTKMQTMAVASYSITNSSGGAHSTNDVINDDPGVSNVVPKEPLAYCRLIVNFPKTMFGIMLTGHIFMLILTIILVSLGKDVFVAEFQQIPIDLVGEDVTLKYWAWSYRNDPTHVIKRFSWDLRTWDRGMSQDPLKVMYFRTKRENIFTKAILLQIEAFEKQMLQAGDYSKLLCQLEIDGTTCIKPNSVLRYFDGSFTDVNPVFNDTEYNNISAVIWEASHNPRTRSKFQYFLGNKTKITQNSAYTDYTRSDFFIGFPISGQSWSSYIGKVLFHNVVGQMNILRDTVAVDINIATINWSMFVTAASIYGFHDLLLVTVSVLFIFIFVLFQTQSLFITTLAIFSIVTSFLGTNLLYRYVLDYQYFGYFHLISMFVILGIGADDIFVFFNTWKSSALEKYPNNAIRLSEVYRRAAVSMFVTSFTTMVAFFVTSITPLLAGRSFGIFTGILVLINYISVVIFFPTVVYFYHLYFEEKDICAIIGNCMKHVQRKKVSSDADRNVYIENNVKDKERWVVYFFSEPYFRFITHPVCRWVLLGLSVTMLALCSWGVSTLESDTEQVMIFKDTTVLGKGWKLFFTAFQPNDDTLLTTNIVWGLRPRNDTRCHFSDYKCRGDAHFDDNFDMNIPLVQLAMRDFCSHLKHNLTNTQLEALNIRHQHGQAEVGCFMDNMALFLKAEEKRLNNGLCRKQKLDLSFPLTELKVRPFMQCQPWFYDTDNLGPSFYCYFEVMLSYWLTNGYTMIPTHDFNTFSDLLGEAKGDKSHVVEIWKANGTLGLGDLVPELENITLPEYAKPVYGTRLKFAAIPVNLTNNFIGLGYLVGLPIYNNWEAYLLKYIPELPPQMRLAMQTNGGEWHWLFIQKTLVTSALIGIGLGIALALPVLIIATRNFIIGTLATVIITAICVCVVGVIPIPGWKIGILVSINLCIVVGLSIDYIVHMAEAYHMSKQESRLERVRESLQKTAISVVSGAITTLVASLFMFFGKTQFFLQFAAFMVSTICFSAFFSLAVFPLIMSMCGPTGEFGSIIPIWNAFKNSFTGRKKADTDCANCSGRGFLQTPQTGIIVTNSRTLEQTVYEPDINVEPPDIVFTEVSHDNLCFEADTTSIASDKRISERPSLNAIADISDTSSVHNIKQIADHLPELQQLDVSPLALDASTLDLDANTLDLDVSTMDLDMSTVDLDVSTLQLDASLLQLNLGCSEAAPNGCMGNKDHSQQMLLTDLIWDQTQCDPTSRAQLDDTTQGIDLYQQGDFL